MFVLHIFRPNASLKECQGQTVHVDRRVDAKGFFDQLRVPARLCRPTRNQSEHHKVKNKNIIKFLKNIMSFRTHHKAEPTPDPKSNMVVGLNC